MYVLDTNVISELRKGKKAERCGRRPPPTASFYLSVVSVLELEIGILLVERRDQKQGAIRRAWIDGHVLPSFSGRILAIDTAVAQRCAALHVPNPRSDRDALMAATALVHGQECKLFPGDRRRRGQPSALTFLSRIVSRILDGVCNAEKVAKTRKCSFGTDIARQSALPATSFENLERRPVRIEGSRQWTTFAYTRVSCGRTSK